MNTVQKLDYYLNGTVFMIKTDHKLFRYLLEAEWMNRKIQQWVLRLNGYNICLYFWDEVLCTLSTFFVLLSSSLSPCLSQRFGHCTQAMFNGCQLSEGKLTGDNWHPLNMACVTGTVYSGEQNKGLSSTFQPSEEGRSVQQPKHCDKHGNKDEGNSPKNVNK